MGKGRLSATNVNDVDTDGCRVRKPLRNRRYARNARARIGIHRVRSPKFRSSLRECSL